MMNIEDYYLIGDLRTAALVSNKGSIDWLCLPYFDSPSVFGKVLDSSAGCFSLDSAGFQVESSYVENTAIVQFTASKDNERFLLTDYMVPENNMQVTNQFLVRNITSISGTPNVKFNFIPRPNYSLDDVKIVRNDELRLEVEIGTGLLILHLPHGTAVVNKIDHFDISIMLEADSNKELTLEFVPAGQATMRRKDFETTTTNFWHNWVDKGRYFDFSKQKLIRSAITLKLLQFHPTGAIIAAPTTSLPEEIGGVRNWDYRYVWIRDATYTLYAFYVLGYYEEAERFFSFIEGITEKCMANNFDVSVMYTIWGEVVPKEQELDHLAGFADSKPVRSGNDAAEQFQLDVYGNLIDAIYIVTKNANFPEETRIKRKQLVMQLVRKIGEVWQKPDSGIWEARQDPKHFTYSKVMAWVGANRASRLQKELSIDGADLEFCKELETTIYNWIQKNCFQTSTGNYSQHPGSTASDSTNLLFVLLQFLDKHDPLTSQIVNKTMEELSFNDVFVYRYLGDDGLAGKEGAFLLCSLWLISAFAILEDVEKAQSLFQQLEKYLHPSGLLSEEIDPTSGKYLGNYPQAFSHLGYIMTAHYINKYQERLKEST
jgi:GH15 family glucan-1,4-alpha-glucosidase